MSFDADAWNAQIELMHACYRDGNHRNFDRFRDYECPDCGAILRSRPPTREEREEEAGLARMENNIDYWEYP